MGRPPAPERPAIVLRRPRRPVLFNETATLVECHLAQRPRVWQLKRADHQHPAGTPTVAQPTGSPGCRPSVALALAARCGSCRRCPPRPASDPGEVPRDDHGWDRADVLDERRRHVAAGDSVRVRLRSCHQTPVERGDSLPEHGRRRACPRLPLVDDGLVRRAHECDQLRLAQPARATQCANLRIVVAWNAGPGQWRATIIWADRAPIVRPPKRPGCGGSHAGSKPAKGGPGVIGHRQPPVPRS